MFNSLRDSLSSRLAPILTWFRAFPRTHRTLIAASAVVASLLVVMVVVVLVTWATGGFSPTLTSDADRNLAQAQQRYDLAIEAAEQSGVAPENDPATTSAQADVVVALVGAGRVDEALDMADELRKYAEGNARALYAVAFAYQQSDLDGYTSQVEELYAQAAVAAGADQTELGRAIYLGYGRVLAEADKLDRSAEYLAQAAAIEPAAAEIYLELAEVRERAQDWYDAALAYASALAYDPLMIAAEEGFDRIAEAHPQEAKQALESPDLPQGGANGHQ